VLTCSVFSHVRRRKRCFCDRRSYMLWRCLWGMCSYGFRRVSETRACDKVAICWSNGQHLRFLCCMQQAQFSDLRFCRLSAIVIKSIQINCIVGETVFVRTTARDGMREYRYDKKWVSFILFFRRSGAVFYCQNARLCKALLGSC